jgi:hypothetical protein
MGARDGIPERLIARLAGRQQGVVARRQLLAEGVSRREVQGRVKKGALLVEFAGVYRVGHRAPSVEARYMAAVLACGKGAVLSGPAAGWVWGLLGRSAPPPEVTAPTHRRIPRILTHRTRSPIQATTHRQIPVTTVPRTLVDLAGSLSLDALARACHEAGVRHGTTPAQVERVLRDRPSAPGQANLRRVLTGDAHVTLSALERRFLALLREEGLPLPVTNHRADGRRVDCRWPEHRLTAELDGFRFHNSRHTWERDRQREREAYARGDQHRRYTYGDVFDEPDLMLAELRGLLRG